MANQPKNSLFVGTVLTACYLLFCLQCNLVHGQHFDPNIDDKSYLDQIEQDVQAEVEKTRLELVHHAKYTQDVAAVYVGAKLKENLFKALRVLAEKEKETIKNAKRDLELKQGKQEEDEEEDGSGDGTTRRPNNIIPVVGNLVKVLFGGNSINLTAYVESASRFLPAPISSQLIGVVRLISNNPSRTTTTAPPEPETTIITLNTTINGTQIPIRVAVPANTSIASIANRVSNSTAGEDAAATGEEEDAEEEISVRQLQLPSLTGSLNFLGTLFGGVTTPRPTPTRVTMRRRGSVRPSLTNSTGTGTTESAAGFDEEKEDPAASTQFSLDGLAMSVRNGLGDMIRIAPDFFKGAREAVRLISGLQSFIGELDI